MKTSDSGLQVNRNIYPDTAACDRMRLIDPMSGQSRDHVVQNLRAYFILHVITIKWKMCVQEKIEFSSMPQRPKLS